MVQGLSLWGLTDQEVKLGMIGPLTHVGCDQASSMQMVTHIEHGGALLRANPLPLAALLEGEAWQEGSKQYAVGRMS